MELYTNPTIHCFFDAKQQLIIVKAKKILMGYDVKVLKQKAGMWDYILKYSNWFNIF
jgi:hypothetical protein